jgi:hypothetical protein
MKEIHEIVALPSILSFCAYVCKVVYFISCIYVSDVHEVQKSFILFFMHMFQMFMKFNVPKDPKSGVAYETTLIGAVLSLSCIPKSEVGPYEFFNNPSSQTKQEHDITESNLWIVSGF